jgi:hypothetical protein
MAHYLVKAKGENLDELRERLNDGEIAQMRPFGEELHGCLSEARVDPEGWITWEETCYCSPPLAQERSVLDAYFSDLTTKTVTRGEGWAQIEHLPGLWAE